MYTYVFVSLKKLLFFIFYLAGGKTFQPTFVHKICKFEAMYSFKTL
jgi:hypothetical protein